MISKMVKANWKTWRRKRLQMPDDTNNCTVISVSIACGVDMWESYDILRSIGRTPRKGVHIEGLSSLDCKRFEKVESGMSLHRFIKDNPVGRFIVTQYKHAFVVINGKVYNHSDVGKATKILKAIKINRL